MEIFDQLGRVRPEYYNGRYYSQGTQHEDKIVHAVTHQTEVYGETVHVVHPSAGALLGEVALFAAFVQHLTGENTKFKVNDVELDVWDLPRTKAAYMSDAEIEQRFAAISGTNALTAQEKLKIIDTALTLSTLFWKRKISPNRIADEALLLKEAMNSDGWPFSTGP